MKIDEAVSILRAHNEWRRAPAHFPEDAMPAMSDPRQIAKAVREDGRVTVIFEEQP